MTAMNALPPQPKVRNPRTHAVIRRETWQQITLPLGLIGLGMAALVVLVVLGTAAPVQTGAFADVSLIFLICLNGLGSLIGLALLGGLIYGVGYLLRESPFWFKRAQDFIWGLSMQVKGMTQQVDNRIVGVHISVAALQSIWAGVRALLAPWRTP